jgi:ABC-type multidrug transport system fused ATPase/permease subunit
MFPFQNIHRYLRTFRRYLGKRLYVVSLLTLLAATTESLGIAFLLPLLALLGVNQANNGNPGSQAAGTAGGAASSLEALVLDVVSALGIRNSLGGILAFICLIFLLKGILKFAEGAYKSHLQAKLLRAVQTELVSAYCTMAYGFYTRHGAGHFSNLISVQVPRVATAFDRYKRFQAALITVIAYFTFAFLISWPFASMATLAGIAVLLVFRRLSGHVRQWSQQEAVEHGTLNHLLVQTLQAYKYLASTSQIGFLRTAVLKSISRVAGLERKKEIAWSFTEASQEPLAVMLLVLIIVVQVRILNQPLAPVVVGLVLLHRAMGQLVQVQGHWQLMMQEVGSLEIVEEELARVESNQEVTGRTILEPLGRGIRLDHVSFEYGDAGGRNVLEDLAITIPANQTIAIVGESGAGKTTLVDLLTLILRPQRGSLIFDGIPHEDVDVTSWRRQIGYVSQDTVVFDDSVANNICLWRGDYATDAEVRRNVELAAARAGAKKFIDALSEGFDTRVGDRGVRLSAGQRQRLFIARELYKNPRLLILDEATSALDSESELVIKESVEQLKGLTTIVIIAHRLSTIKTADYIYVLDRGRIIEQGTYEELAFAHGGTFNRMVALQQL